MTETRIDAPKVFSRFHYGWIVLAMGTWVVFASLGLARFSYSAVLPAMQEGLGMDNKLGGALATANLAGYLVFSVLSSGEFGG